MSCLTGPRCYINTDIQHEVKQYKPIHNWPTVSFDYTYAIYKSGYLYKLKRIKKKKIQYNTNCTTVQMTSNTVHVQKERHSSSWLGNSVRWFVVHEPEDNSSWFGNLLGKPWLWIKEIAILLLFLLLAYYLCIHSIKCFFQQMTPASHEEMTVPTRRDYYP